MRRSARILGKEYGLTAQEMNFVLKEEGFLDGEPGNYFVTEKGAEFAKEQDFHRGTGGYDHYNRYWTTRSWDDSIMDELDITGERKKEIRQAISAAKAKIDTEEDDDITFENVSSHTEDSDTTDIEDNALVAAIVVLLVAASSYGVYKAAPYIKRWWNDKVVPSYKKIKNKVVGNTEKIDEQLKTDNSLAVEDN